MKRIHQTFKITDGFTLLLCGQKGQMFKTFWINHEDQNTSLQWTYNLDTTTFVFKNKIDGKEHLGQIKNYSNQLLYSLECATAQQHSKQ